MAISKSVLITGASTGIGEDAALHLDRLGFNVFAGVRKEKDADALRQKASDRLHPLIIDVKDSDSIAAAIAEIEKVVEGTGLDGLINNAGIVVSGPLEFIPLDAAREQFEVNVIGQIAVTQACMPMLRKATGGRIINIGSIAAIVPKPFAGLYAASKAAMEALTDSLRMELAQWGIEVIIIEPGSIATPIWEKSTSTAMWLLNQMPPAAFDHYGKVIDIVKGWPRKSVAAAIRSNLSQKLSNTR